MNDETGGRIDRLEAGIRRLSEENARMGMIFKAFERFANVEGLDETLDYIIDLSLNLHGGGNVIIYYFLNGHWEYRDLFGNRGDYEPHEGSLVDQAVRTKTIINKVKLSNQATSFRKGKEMIPQDSCTTAYPLVYKGSAVAVLKLSDRLVWKDEASEELMIFYRYAAATLHASIQNYEALELKNLELERSNLELQSIIRDLEHARKIQESLLQEVHHRVKNNLQVMASLVSLQAEGMETMAMKQAFIDIGTRIRSMSMIHESLYKSEDFSSIDLSTYLKSLLSFLASTYEMDSRAVTWEFHSDRVELGMDACVPCGLLLNELVVNAFKYAFPDSRRGTLSVGVKNNKGSCKITVADDGIGLPDGVEPGNGTGGLGFQLIPALIEQIHGELKLRDGPGTIYEITFPLE